MKNVIFADQPDVVVQAEVKKISNHVVQIAGAEENLSGFLLVTNTGGVYGRYDKYNTLYRKINDGYQLSDDGSVYVEPTPEPEPEPYEPTLEEVQEQKVTEMNAAQQAVIQEGINVTLTDGTVEHFTLTDHDQTSLNALQSKVESGEQLIPWHTSDETEHCKFYSNADMAIITSSAMAYVTWHVTYFRDLRIYIRSIQDKEEVAAVTYGMDIPVEFQSEPLKAMLAAQK